MKLLCIKKKARIHRHALKLGWFSYQAPKLYCLPIELLNHP